MSARDEVLSRIRTATGYAPGEGGEEDASTQAGEIPHGYRLRRDADASAALERAAPALRRAGAVRELARLATLSGG